MRAIIADLYFGKTPEEKVAIVESETRQATTLFVGDGVNDAPAMLAATVGVAFGHTSDVTAETASAVVLRSGEILNALGSSLNSPYCRARLGITSGL